MSEDTPALPTNAEDLKRHKALSAIEDTSSVVTDTDDNNSNPASSAALGEALGSISSAKVVGKQAQGTGVVKVKAEDVSVVMDQLELSKPKATDALRRNGGDLVTTLREYVRAA